MEPSLQKYTKEGLHLDYSSAKTYACNQGGTVSLSLSRLACHILNLANKYDSTLIPAYIPTDLNVEAVYLSQERLFSEWHLLPHLALAVFQLWGQPEVDLLLYSHTNQCWHYYTLENPLPLGAFSLNSFQPSLEI